MGGPFILTSTVVMYRLASNTSYLSAMASACYIQSWYPLLKYDSKIVEEKAMEYHTINVLNYHSWHLWNEKVVEDSVKSAKRFCQYLLRRFHFLTSNIFPGSSDLPLLEPLNLNSSPNPSPKREEKANTNLRCLFCSKIFLTYDNTTRDGFLEHLVMDHKFVIGDVKLIPNFEK